ncbi:hypothetical protein CAL29_28245 [Bordetella genomosp. 10]|uniref:Uncharacterized protein n=1 Tax=Bordetella genomosp. 10 TaxID=1416804 RepID=A0A261S5Q3_9BORD|nr:hypothetical protein [Bordetella genomosp. 10]OZI31763.1 hypothetical protein CAL29_28245 [Bordetella genomosp. 10]
MTTTMQIEQRRRAMLIQALEERWPGCGAHSKRDQQTAKTVIVISDALLSGVQRQIHAYIDGWEAGGAAMLACLQAAAPFPDVDTAALARGQRQGSVPRRPRARGAIPAPKGRQRQESRAAEARANLEALFSPDGGDQE